MLGELIDETDTHYFYHRFGNVLASIEKRRSTIHLVPCKACPDFSSSEESDEIANS